jgi:hypothetical protein
MRHPQEVVEHLEIVAPGDPSEPLRGLGDQRRRLIGSAFFGDIVVKLARFSAWRHALSLARWLGQKIHPNPSQLTKSPIKKPQLQDGIPQPFRY